MFIYLTFLKKELIELLQNKKILMYLIVCLFIPIIMNIIAVNPLIELEIIAPLYVVMSACVVTELVKSSLVEEFRLLTFNNLLVAPFKNEYLIFYKTTLQIVVAFIATVLGLIINDAFQLFVPKFNYFMIMTSFSNIVIAFLSACVCAWISYYLFIRQRDVSDKTHTTSLGILVAILGIIAVISNKYNLFVILILSIIFLLIAFFISKITLISPQPIKKRKSIQVFRFFRNQNLKFVSAMIAKDCAMIKISDIVELLFYILVVFFNEIQIVFYFMIFLIATFGSRKLLYQSIVEEKLNKTMAILQLQKSKSYIFMTKTIVPSIISIISSAVAIIISGQIILDFYWIVIVILFSSIITYIITLFVERPKEISIGSMVLGIVLMVLYSMCIVVYIYMKK